MLIVKPYVKVFYNYIKILGIRVFCCPDIRISGYCMLDFNTKIKAQRTSKIHIGNKVISDGRCTIIVDSNAELSIGDRVYFNEGMMISSKSSVKIGDNCQFGPNVKIFDNNHCYSAETGVQHAHTTKPIKIGNNCWIATNVVVLQGTTIGDNCVIGAGCVVRGHIPSGSIVTQEGKLVIRPIEGRQP